MAKQNEIKFLTSTRVEKRQKKYCRFKKMGIRYVDYKDAEFLKKFLNDQGKMLPRRITEAGEENTAENEIATVDTLKHVFTAGELNTAGDPIPGAWVGKSLYTLMLERTIVPNQMHIVREVLYDEDPSNNVDTAIFAGNRDWYEITQFEDGSVRVARREM